MSAFILVAKPRECEWRSLERISEKSSEMAAPPPLAHSQIPPATQAKNRIFFGTFLFSIKLINFVVSLRWDQFVLER